MIDAARIIERAQAVGLTQAELARRVGISQPAVGKMFMGQTQNSVHLSKIAAELATSPAYLLGETDDPSPGALPVPRPEELAERFGLALVPEINLAYGMGGGTVVEGPVEVETIAFPTSWLRTITRAPVSALTFARGRGDSMTPTIGDGDVVLIDRSQNAILDQDLIWAVAFGDLGMIKRVRRMPGGMFKLLSDNHNVTPETVTGDELFVVGRVVWAGRGL